MIDDATYATLRQNLLELTAAVAPQYDQYGNHFFASRAYRTFEDALLEEVTALLYPRTPEIFVDLGCATGYQVFRAAPQFKRLFGFDLSPDMIVHARRKIDPSLRERIIFNEVDLDDGIPLETDSVSLITLNLGTASNIRNIGALLGEVQRVLRRAGKFLFSFYNRDALVYQWNLHPWLISIAAVLDHDNHCLNVNLGEKVFSVYARAYTAVEIQALMPDHLKIIRMATYPAISSILPESAFQERRARTAILKLDRELSATQYGAYNIVIGERSVID